MENLENRTSDADLKQAGGSEEGKQKTWAEEHGGTLVAVIGGVLLVLVILFNLSC